MLKSLVYNSRFAWARNTPVAAQQLATYADAGNTFDAGTSDPVRVWKNDWQGRVELSSEPRTNYLIQTSDMRPGALDNGWINYWNGADVTIGQPDPAGGNNACLLVPVMTGDHVGDNGVIAVAPDADAGSPPFVGPAKSGVWLKEATEGAGGHVHVSHSGSGDSSLVIAALTSEWQYVEIAFTHSDTDTIYPARRQMIMVGSDPFLAFAPRTTKASEAGVYIPTTDAPVTVTDYTQSANQIALANDLQAGESINIDSTAAYQLVDNGGRPLTSEVKIARITRHDWQGTVELSSEPRTNYIWNSSDFAVWAGANTIVQNGVAAPDGSSAYMQRVTCTTASPDCSAILNTDAGTSQIVVGDQYVISAIVRRDQNQFANIHGFGNGGAGVGFDLVNGVAQVNPTSAWDSCGIVLLSSTLALIWGSLKPLVNGIVYLGVSDFIGGSGNAAVGSYLDWYQPMLESGETYGVRIPTTGSQVTVTDYTTSPTGSIALSQLTVLGNSLTWRGKGIRG